MIVNAEWIVWLLVLVGCVPYVVQRQVIPVRGRGRRRWTVRWEVRAHFWRLTMERTARGQVNWRVAVPLVEWLKAKIWAAVREVIKP